MKKHDAFVAVMRINLGYGAPCVLCGRKVGRKGGYIPRPRDRRPAGVRCAYCYRRYLRKHFPEALAE